MNSSDNSRFHYTFPLFDASPTRAKASPLTFAIGLPTAWCSQSSHMVLTYLPPPRTLLTRWRSIGVRYKGGSPTASEPLPCRFSLHKRVSLRSRFSSSTKGEWLLLGSPPPLPPSTLLSVRYGASGAPKPAGPRPNSPPRPGPRPGAGLFFFCPPPRPLSGPPPRSRPQTAPRKSISPVRGPAFSPVPCSHLGSLKDVGAISWS